MSIYAGFRFIFCTKPRAVFFVALWWWMRERRQNERYSYFYARIKSVWQISWNFRILYGKLFSLTWSRIRNNAAPRPKRWIKKSFAISGDIDRGSVFFYFRLLALMSFSTQKSIHAKYNNKKESILLIVYLG